MQDFARASSTETPRRHAPVLFQPSGRALKITAQQRASLCEHLEDVPVRALHRVENLINKGQWNVLVEQGRSSS